MSADTTADKITTSATAFGAAIAEGLAGVRTELKELRTDVDQLKTDVAELKTDVADLKMGMAHTNRLTIGLIDAVNANTRSIEAALTSAGIPVRLVAAKKS
ncbi:MAG: hypothetical protein SF002_01010 [Alphaproteobacteria bacterium]|nr:hypothetical protein [Alphaproteobacteria bacterium]